MTLHSCAPLTALRWHVDTVQTAAPSLGRSAVAKLLAACHMPSMCLCLVRTGRTILAVNCAGLLLHLCLFTSVLTVLVVLAPALAMVAESRAVQVAQHTPEPI